MNDEIQSLFVDKRTLASEIAKEASELLRIDSGSCTPILPFPLGKLKVRERILVVLGTAYFCYAGGVTKTALISREVLQKKCKIEAAALRARLSDLRKEQLVDSTSEGEEITTGGLIELRALFQQLKAVKVPKER